ncbi:MAG: hypothetical protein DIU80_000625 [Chloroflexota bacterium]
MTQRVDPYSIEIRYMLDRMGQLLYRERPRRVRVYSDDREIVLATARRLGGDYMLSVETPALADDVRGVLGIRVEVAGDAPADAAFAPLSLGRSATPRERVLIGAVRNPFSYKTLRYPGQVSAAGMRALAWARRAYRVDTIVGMYPPHCAGLLALAGLVGRWGAASYFRLTDLAMRHIYAGAPAWRLSYVVIFAGRRAGQ